MIIVIEWLPAYGPELNTLEYVFGLRDHQERPKTSVRATSAGSLCQARGAVPHGRAPPICFVLPTATLTPTPTPTPTPAPTPTPTPAPTPTPTAKPPAT